MSIRKSLIAAAAMALALMGFSSSAMAATDGVVRDVTDNSIIPVNTELHAVGWARFSNAFLGSYECHVTGTIVATGLEGKTGHVKTFTIPDTTKCTGTGSLKECTPEKHESTTPWHVTTTPTDFDVTPIAPATALVIHIKFKNEHSACSLRGTEITLTFPEITLKPLKTNNGTTTGTAGKVHEKTAGTGVNAEPIAGVEISGSGTVHTILGSFAVTAAGENELTSVTHRCTWKIVSS